MGRALTSLAPVGVGPDSAVFVYLDDILVLSSDRLKCVEVTQRLASFLESSGLVLSSKCALEPSQEIDCLGKTFDFRARSVGNSLKMTQKFFALALSAMLYPVTKKRPERLLGVWNWCAQPRSGFLLFAAQFSTSKTT